MGISMNDHDAEVIECVVEAVRHSTECEHIPVIKCEAPAKWPREPMTDYRKAVERMLWAMADWCSSGNRLRLPLNRGGSWAVLCRRCLRLLVRHDIDQAASL